LDESTYAVMRFSVASEELQDILNAKSDS